MTPEKMRKLLRLLNARDNVIPLFNDKRSIVDSWAYSPTQFKYWLAEEVGVNLDNIFSIREFFDILEKKLLALEIAYGA